MRKYWFIFLTACSISTFCFNNVEAYKKEYDLLNNPTLNFKDHVSKIKLKVKSQVQDINDYTDRVLSNDFSVSYIIEVVAPLSDRSHQVYIVLLDKEGFEVAQKFITNAAENYTGTLRGSFLLDPKLYKEISGAELIVTRALS